MDTSQQERRAAELVMDSAAFRETIAALTERTGRTEEDLRHDAEVALEEMSACIDESASRVWDRLGRWLTRSYEVDVDTARLTELAELGQEHSLVFLPNHRSYLDPLVLRAATRGHRFPANYTLGGNNLALWPLSKLGKRSGLIFIRRSTRDDPVYPEMLRLYLGFLLRHHANLEWYFEGGRTRTGKLRPPRMGVLRYLVDAFQAGGDTSDDAYLVPVSIVYDQQHEVSALSREEMGGTKVPESLTWAYRFARAQGRRRGRVHVRFGPPLSLREALADAGSRADSDDLTEVVPRVAFEVAHRINAATPITPAALVTFGLLDNDGRAMTLGETLGVLEPLVAYVRHRQLPLTADVDLGRPEGLRRALATLVRENVVVEYTGGLEPVYAIAPDRHHEAGFYRNTVTHYFINRAILEVALVQVAQEPTDPDVDVIAATWRHALALRDLLKYEFFFPTKGEFDAQLRRETDIIRSGWTDEHTSAGDILDRLGKSDLLLAHRVIGPFLEAYSVVADRLVTREPAAPLDGDDLIGESLGYAHQRWLQQDLHSPESISKDLMGGALRLAGNRDLLGPGGDDLIAARRRFADELAEAVHAIAVVRSHAVGG